MAGAVGALASAVSAGCDKVGYRGRKRARHAARMLRERSSEPFRAYRCPDCGLWHLSSQPKRKAVRHRRTGAKTGRRLRSWESIEEVAQQMREAG